MKLNARNPHARHKPFIPQLRNLSALCWASGAAFAMLIGACASYHSSKPIIEQPERRGRIFTEPIPIDEGPGTGPIVPVTIRVSAPPPMDETTLEQERPIKVSDLSLEYQSADYLVISDASSQAPTIEPELDGVRRLRWKSLSAGESLTLGFVPLARASRSAIVQLNEVPYPVKRIRPGVLIHPRKPIVSTVPVDLYIKKARSDATQFDVVLDFDPAYISFWESKPTGTATTKQVTWTVEPPVHIQCAFNKPVSKYESSLLKLTVYATGTKDVLMTDTCTFGAISDAYLDEGH